MQIHKGCYGYINAYFFIFDFPYTFEIYSLCLFLCVSTTIPVYSLVLPFNLHFIIKVLCARKTVGWTF